MTVSGFPAPYGTPTETQTLTGRLSPTPTPTHLMLTQGVRLSILIRNRKHANHFMTLLAEVCVYFLSKQALTNQGQL